jgi:hypothetical protein
MMPRKERGEPIPHQARCAVRQSNETRAPEARDAALRLGSPRQLNLPRVSIQP